MVNKKINSLVLAGATCLLMVVFLQGCGTMTGGSASDGADANVLKVGVTPNTPPFAFKRGNKITGLEADMAAELGKNLGRPVRFVEVKWNDQIPALLDGKTDIVMSGMSITDMRQVRVAFSDPYLRIGQMALARRDDVRMLITRGSIMLTRGKVGVEKGATGEFFVQREFPYATAVSFNSAEEAVKALVRGNIDLMIHDAPVAWWLAAQHEADGISAVNIILSSEYLAWAVRNDDLELLDSVNRFLDLLRRDGRWNRIVRRWLPYMK